ncbi:TIGR04290 family methyltransferase [Pontibacter akesuensis]|uniref:tRNA (Mo5U34)-methyltransferase n=1 Tax=Pontibacter akesuensis TaxID=388950 RepID=A0A1I7H3C8_9BACT|nr:TIGR04290 family methyltransferase [Pontibacter akesuensis]GHA53688.1 methyltransferase, TIGR04290 family protein [Pontibacter akesuensis]SFU55170.1 tRNA (mo5U34)-methyltransferase [Pontibacter akesuensis]
MQQEIEQLGPWFHNLHLPGGEQTAPNHFLGDFPNFKWKELEPHIPADLSGKNVLDIGCNAGFYSIELAKRGANVLGIDVDPHYLRQAAWAARQFGLEDKIELQQLQVYDVARLDRQFDLIWYMGVLYHLRYPLLSLDILSQKCRGQMVFQTLSMPGDQVTETPDDFGINDRQRMLEEGWPKMAFIEKRMAGDITNWWAPNHAAIEAMMRSCGFRVKARPGHELYLLEVDEQLKQHQQWNASEYLSATGQDWQEAVQQKVAEKNEYMVGQNGKQK